VFCQRCGAENERSSRYCSSCGAELRREPRPAPGIAGVRARVSRFVGRSRRERYLTLSTVALLVVAVGAFVALEDDDDAEEPDAAQIAEVDRGCLAAKEAVAAAATDAVSPGGGGAAGYGLAVVQSTLDFREIVRTLPVGDSGVSDLDRTLRDAAIGAGTLARLARQGAAPAELRAQQAELDRRFIAVDEAIEAVGLPRCRGVAIVPAGS
jgi:zinc-ribbon domain